MPWKMPLEVQKPLNERSVNVVQHLHTALLDHGNRIQHHVCFINRIQCGLRVYTATDHHLVGWRKATMAFLAETPLQIAKRSGGAEEIDRTLSPRTAREAGKYQRPLRTRMARLTG